MLILIVLLASLVSILMITLLNINKVNSQVILFLLVLISMILFKFVMNKLVKVNSMNPISKNLISNVDMENQTPKDEKNSDNDEVINKIILNLQMNVNRSENENEFYNENENEFYNENEIYENNNQTENNGLTNNNVNLNLELTEKNFLNPDIEIVNKDLNNLGNKVINVNTNGNLEANLVSTIPKNSPENSCLLEKCPCKKISQNVCCNSIDTNKTPCGNCPTSDFINGEKVNKECLKNNTINYADVFNSDASQDAVLEMNVPSNDCAFDSRCVTPAFAGTLHFSSPQLTNQNNSNSENFWRSNQETEILQREKLQFRCN